MALGMCSAGDLSPSAEVARTVLDTHEQPMTREMNAELLLVRHDDSRTISPRCDLSLGDPRSVVGCPQCDLCRLAGCPSKACRAGPGAPKQLSLGDIRRGLVKDDVVAE